MIEPHNLSDSATESDEGFDTSFFELTTNFTEKTKIFNDMVHPHLELPAICCRIINTPQFQRLRNLKQLGLCYYVYPSASHNRFEHCVGTSYLAGKYAKRLQETQPELHISDEDILCLYIAGLCHDIGHGPFSHTWEKFIHDVGNKDYSHEDMSLKMLDYLIEDNNLMAYFAAENLGENDVTFIKELILGHPLPRESEFKGRKPCKHFLYQIVANGKTKIDVDKFDYLLRDCKQLNVTTVFDYQRLLDNSRVVGYKDGEMCLDIQEETPTIIVYRKKISDSLKDLFDSRFSMHQKAYQHRVTKVIEEMVLDGLKAADPYFEVPGRNGKSYRLSTAYQDPNAFMKLTDSVLESIIHWNKGGEKAAEIFNKVVLRKLYPFLGGFSAPVEKSAVEKLLIRDPNIRLISTKINYGSGQKNPLNEVLLYEKEQPHKLLSKTYSQSAPEESRTFIVYAGDSIIGFSPEGNNNGLSIESDVHLKNIRSIVTAWAEEHQVVLEYE